MVSDNPEGYANTGHPTVLILVLMEYGLWLGQDKVKEINRLVLILVLMEYGLWPFAPCPNWPPAE